MLSEVVYFNFRIMEQADGSQLINDKVKTPIDSLTPEMQVEYMEVENQLAFMERIRKKEQRERQECRQKSARNPFYRLACMCGLF